MRFELTARDAAAVDRALPLLAEYRITQVNVTDTSKAIDTVPLAGRLLAARPGLDIMLHIACRHHSPESFEAKVAAATSVGVQKLLLVSGHPRGAFDSITSLRVIPDKAASLSPGSTQLAQSYVVHNPYYSGDSLVEENTRLEKKLSYEHIRGVALQIGQDGKKCSDAVRRIRSLRSDIHVLASLPIATGNLLERMRTKILHGVFLDHAFLYSVDHAKRQVKEMAKRFKDEGVEPIVFAMDLNREVIETALEME